MNGTTPKPSGDIAELLAIMRRLRDPNGGCPWDLEQNFATIAPYTIEEAYEVASAIEAKDYAGLKDELGDLLFAVVNLARFLDADPAAALHRACDRFDARFRRVCELVRAEGKEPRACTLQELDAAWDRAKREGVTP